MQKMSFKPHKSPQFYQKSYVHPPMLEIIIVLNDKDM